MRNMIQKVVAVVLAALLPILTGCKKAVARVHEDESGVEIIVVIILLAILVSIAALFRTQITAFVNNLFGQILSF